MSACLKHLSATTLTGLCCTDQCAGQGIAFIPYLPLATGAFAAEGSPVAELARTHGATPAQIAPAWPLKRLPVMLPIPGTSSVEHLDDNMTCSVPESS